ncbi:MAG TPA: MT-A70 family methyltransferase [Mycobacterium sp.]|nr:MT-A70 family methyltransferase [Mycobacterium sp.]
MTTYSVIAADCPWAPKDKLPGAKRGAARNYNVLPVDKLCSFLVDNRIQVAADAILFLWRLSSMQQEALDVARSWGFVVKSEVVWQKLTPTGLHHFGMGRTVRASHETCLICVRGRGGKLVRNHGIRSTFAAPTPTEPNGRARHSAKPPEFFSAVVEPMLGLPRDEVACVEIFARSRRIGWDAVGDQLPAQEAA